MSPTHNATVQDDLIDPTQEFFTTGQVAALAKVFSRTTIVELIDKGELPASRIRTHRRVSRRDLIAWARRRSFADLYIRLTGNPPMPVPDLQEKIVALLGEPANQAGMTGEAIQDALRKEDWTFKEMALALLGLREDKKLCAFKPTKGRKKDNGKVHYCLPEFAPHDPNEVGWAQIPRVQ
jgi:excisionase family DNA binding protein